MKFKLGVVPYLNSQPLIHGLTDRSDIKIVFQPPRQLAASLKKGRLVVSLLPVIEYLKHRADYRFIPGISISARGAGESVRLFFPKNIDRLKKVWLDRHSLTSNTLVRIILKKKYGLEPVFRLPPSGQSLDLRNPRVGWMAIGDRALRWRQRSVRSLDLAQAWFELTGLSFVFALWVYRKKTPLAGIAKILRAAKKAGLRRRREIADRESAKLRLPRKFCYHYLTKCMRYDLGTTELAGLRKFNKLAGEMGLLK
ncbi:MAG: menaquinone biosynthesis protein [Planctomycetes bacterium]|nr:menaquinone biosynthesis protein [Planctomycetota bacterium]